MFPCVFIRCRPALPLGIESLVFRFFRFPVSSFRYSLLPCSLSLSALFRCVFLPSLLLLRSLLSFLLPPLSPLSHSRLFLTTVSPSACSRFSSLSLLLSLAPPLSRFSSLSLLSFSLPSSLLLPPPLLEPDRRTAGIYFAAAFLVVAFLAAGFFAVFASSFTAVLAGDFRAAGSFSTFASALTALLRVVFFFGSGVPALRA